MRYSRRLFIKQQSLTGLGMALTPVLSAFAWRNPGEIKCVFPIDGDLLHAQDGLLTDAGLKTVVKVSAPPDSIIWINNIRAESDNGLFSATVLLDNYRQLLEIRDSKSGAKKSIEIYWARNLAGKYRLSIDDAIWFLKDISENAGKYQSLFENPFLKFLKEVHDAYRTKVHINIFYETEGFNLSQMTDKFRAEWKQHAGWLQLSFHARAEMPDDPYKKAGYAQVMTECQAVIKQIRRFAGDELSGPVTTLHWGEVPVAVSRALRDAGYTGQVCDFNCDDQLPPCSYYLNLEERRHMKKRFVWKDTKEGIVFIKSCIIINTVELSEITPFLDQYEKESRKPPYADLLTHEQYFYPEYPNYQSDYREKVLRAVQWAVKNDYTASFISDCIYA